MCDVKWWGFFALDHSALCYPCTRQFLAFFLHLGLLDSAQWCKMTNSSPLGGKVGKKLLQLDNIQNIGSLLF